MATIKGDRIENMCNEIKISVEKPKFIFIFAAKAIG